MVAEDITSHPGAPTAAVPGQSRRRLALSPGDRIVRQLQSMDAWIAARREREQALYAQGRRTRAEHMDVAREIDVLRRTHDAIKGRCASGLDSAIEPLLAPGPTAVIAHHHAWFVDKLAAHLGEHGVTVVVCTDNGAEALGALVAEQPDLLVLGDPLAMMPAATLMAEARRYAPGTLLAVQAGPEHADQLWGLDDTVFHRQDPPAVVAEALLALYVTRIAQPDRV